MEDNYDSCGICGTGSWVKAMQGEPDCQGHVWTSATLLRRQAAAHFDRKADLDFVVVHQPRLCPVCLGIDAPFVK